jgi:glycosyltransferase involved in cell wall biosynthesis
MTLAEEFGVAPQIRFLGIQRDIRPYLRLCDVFVLPSLAEGLGIALVEAMAMKRACVATRVAALPEVVSEGRSGLLVNPADPPGLAAAICQLLGHPSLRARMGEEGRRIVLERFNVDRTIGELESLYCRVSITR